MKWFRAVVGVLMFDVYCTVNRCCIDGQTNGIGDLTS